MKEENKPLVTIVTPSYNQGQFIEETILSVLNQTYNNIQYIIIDGDSTDGTKKVLDKYKNRVDVIISEKDKGQTDAINKGFKLAKGELVGWLNSDDIFYSDCVQRIVELYLRNHLGAIFYSSKINFIDDISIVFKIKCLKIPDRNFLLNKNYSVNQQGSFYATEIVKKCNYLNENLHYCMDLDLWLRLLEHGHIYSYSSESLAGFRFWEETKTINGGQYFLREIRKTLLTYGASTFSLNIIRTYLYEWKILIKKVFQK